MIQNYRVIMKIGEGKTVDVYLAIKDNKCVAIKVQKMLEDEIKMCYLSQAFIEEISALEKARHPFIIGLIESFLWEDENHNFRWCIVLENADGGDLYEKYWSPKRKVSEKQALNWAAQIILALHHLHMQGIKIYEIKPQNIVIVGENLGGIAKIGDLRHIKEDYFGRSNTKLASTSLYFAPEILQKRDSPLMDVWSLGILMYELLTGGEHPFEDNLNGKNYLTRLPRLDYRQNPSISPQFKELIQLMLEKDASKRISIEQLMKDPFIKRKIDVYIDEMIFGEQITAVLSGQITQDYKEGAGQVVQPQAELPLKHQFEENKLAELIARIKEDGHQILADLIIKDEELLQRLKQNQDIGHTVEWNRFQGVN
ncbi:hypothetical protein FGO68_gene4227 [Halteria grandinella]|uniref:non-specific serine/threonine protein kinase n=1 Tax=Halteria grandinella TaxID=5974 RepID=A0A8J8T2W6_HALGN|nr:hypothetical protein FGO68_gene4227 [Halteria grandinella]